MAITGFKVAVGVASSNVSRGSVVSKGSYSLTFDKPVLYRETADGLHLIHANGAHVTEYAPALTTIDGGSVNGFSPNIAPNDSISAGWQGQDGRMNGTIITGTSSYSAAKRPSLPWRAEAGDSVVLQNAAALVTGVANPHRAGLATDWHGVQFVSALPFITPARLLSGCLAYWFGKTDFCFDVDIDGKLAALPSYALTGGSYPPVADALDRLDKFWGLGLHCATDGSSFGYEPFSPQGVADPTGTMSNYGQYLARMVGAGALHMIGNVATSEQKRRLLIRFIQIGCQIFESSRESGVYPGTAAFGPGIGGHSQWEFAPIVTYLWARGLTSDLDSLRSTYAGNVLGQPFIYTAGQVSALAPHSTTTSPNISRRRTVSAVSGNQFAITTYPPHDLPRLDLTGLRIVRESDSASAIITAIADTSTSGGTLTVTIDAQPGSPFANGNVVYCQAQHTITAGDADWRIYPADSAICPNAQADYRPQNFFMEELLFAKALGVWRSDWDAMQAYVERSMLSNNPGSGAFDYLAHAEAVSGYNMALEFYNAHKGTLGIA